MVGRSAPDQIGFETVFEAFRWTESGGMIAMGDLDGGVARSSAYAVSTDGTFIVGTTETGGFRWQMSTGMLPLTDPPGELADMSPLGVSTDGSVILGFGPSPSGGNVAGRWTAATGTESLGALPNSLGFPDAYLVSCSADGTAATGNSFGDFVQPTRWTQQGGLEGLGDVPGGEMYGLGEGMSADGTTIVGNARHTVNSFPRDEAFLWREATGFFLLDPMNAAEFESNARACSADGSIVVGYFEGASGGAMI